MKVIYTAGPYRADNAWQVEQNVRRAEAIGYAIAKTGAVPLIPHSQSRFFAGTLTEDYWLRATMALLRRCDAVYMVPGWEGSAGSIAELAEAERLGLPVIYDLSQLYEYVKESKPTEEKRAAITL